MEVSLLLDEILKGVPIQNPCLIWLYGTLYYCSCLKLIKGFVIDFGFAKPQN